MRNAFPASAGLLSFFLVLNREEGMAVSLPGLLVTSIDPDYKKTSFLQKDGTLYDNLTLAQVPVCPYPCCLGDGRISGM